MGDGSGMSKGGFKISSHSFTKQQNQLLGKVLLERYGLQTGVHRDRQYHHLYIKQESVYMLHILVKPYLLPSCHYKFRFVK